MDLRKCTISQTIRHLTAASLMFITGAIGQSRSNTLRKISGRQALLWVQLDFTNFLPHEGSIHGDSFSKQVTFLLRIFNFIAVSIVSMKSVSRQPNSLPLLIALLRIVSGVVSSSMLDVVIVSKHYCQRLCISQGAE